jgi:uracil-DNA glycosylase
MSEFNIHPSWIPLFDKWNDKLKEIISSVYDPTNTKQTFPPQELVFTPFTLDLTRIKLVLLGQDVYHGPLQAMGLSFSVPKNVKIPPSLVNIFKELSNEFPERNYTFTHGDLTLWASREHIFLLNCALTVKQATPLSHISIWQEFTDDVIKYIVTNNKECIFLLLGNYAKAKAKMIKNESRCVMGVHPSPLSAHNGFFNSDIFKKVETKLNYQINWQN